MKNIVLVKLCKYIVYKLSKDWTNNKKSQVSHGSEFHRSVGQCSILPNEKNPLISVESVFKIALYFECQINKKITPLGYFFCEIVCWAAST